MQLRLNLIEKFTHTDRMRRRWLLEFEFKPGLVSLIGRQDVLKGKNSARSSEIAQKMPINVDNTNSLLTR